MATKGGSGATAYAASKAGVIGKKQKNSHDGYPLSYIVIYSGRYSTWQTCSLSPSDIGFTRALCRELGPRSIRVNALLPGWIASDMWDSMFPPCNPFILTLPLAPFLNTP
jgi:3-oxoacyl-[acyl-carrier protein] reductase